MERVVEGGREEGKVAEVKGEVGED